jgi:hypothetical protein
MSEEDRQARRAKREAERKAREEEEMKASLEAERKRRGGAVTTSAVSAGDPDLDDILLEAEAIAVCIMLTIDVFPISYLGIGDGARS